MTQRAPDDSKVGSPRGKDDGRQTPEQRALLGGGGEVGGAEEPHAGWGAGGPKGEPGRAPVALGGSSQGQSDRMPAGGTRERASNPKVTPGEPHEA